MAQNIYDDPAFFAGYSRLPRQTLGLNGAPEWPAVRALIPDLTGRRVLDLGCGFGWTARWMRERGAASVLGLDLSETMLARARADTADPAIQYRAADLEGLDLPDDAFDFAFSALAFHYVRDFDRLVRAIGRALTPGGGLVFTVEHPIYTAAARPGWLTDPNGRKTWPVDQYALEGERRTNWFVKGVLKHHRTLGTTLNALIRAGFAIQAVEEFAPTTEQISRSPDLAEELERPMMLIVSARKAA